MKIHLFIPFFILFIAPIGVIAQSPFDLKAYSNSKDSLMSIEFFDNNFSAYKKNYDEYLTTYNKQTAKDKEKLRRYLDEMNYYLAGLYAQKNEKDNAMACLQKSGDNNYKDLCMDKMFDNLRKDPRFVKYLDQTKNRKSKYQLLLQADTKYGTARNDGIPAFSYQSGKDPNLVALKKAYNLDSIAGTGGDVTRIINLMEWVHYLIRHDGSGGNPSGMNATNLINECTRNGKTVNCRGMAVTLNEVYLAAGFKSRYVTCLPKDTADNDCHVITMVWSTSLKKWLWMDATFMEYVMDETGTPLSIEEVRDRLVHNKPLLLNPDANHNRQNGETVSGLLNYYMSKNLYQIECPVSSEYNYESSDKAQAYITLVPGSHIPTPQITKNKHGMVVYSAYFTNDPKVFWAAPPGVPSGEQKDGAGHTQSQYEQVMAKLKDCYNSTSGTCVDALMMDELKGWMTDDMLKEDFGKLGRMRSCKYLGMEVDNWDQDVALFKIVCDSSVHCMGISLDNDNKIGTYRFMTSSNYITWLMAKDADKTKADN
jgi:Transglutaminase-like superfamily